MIKEKTRESNVMNMPDKARVWIHQSSEPLDERSRNILLNELALFIQSWKTHGKDLSAAGDFLHNRFLIVAVDEEQLKASGCSIDSLVAFIKSMEKMFEVDFFDRQAVAYIKQDQIIDSSLNEMEGLYKKRIINDDTLVFNNLVSKMAEFKKHWITPLGKSWHKQFV